ncbi:MAG: hypothetical protein JWQ89_3441 [Devosia sp.]|uniref:tripartite tricarboxylate transporter TctB family protein n=1 Tax=Devosia sp. TaxID=1871048 RepID=UPI00261765B4|nr:tripartite tricarboxylate transporter TctB family protein [Devosia sp.]MDB5541714.1 hypothetical protein [Devosia sp.]
MTRTYDRIGYVAVLLLGLGAFWLTLDFAPESAIFPQLVSGVLAAMGALHLVGSFLGGPATVPEPEDDASGGYQLDASEGFFDSPVRFGIIFTASLAYCIGIAVIGYYTATLIFVPVALVALGYRKPMGIFFATVGYVLVTWLVITVIFSRVLPSERILQLFG